jgi:hypothetical protein
MHGDLRHSTSAGVGCLAALVLIIAVPIGVLLFGVMALTGYSYGNYEFMLIGLAALCAIVAGLYCLFHPPRR